MRKLYLHVALFFFSVLSSFAQTSPAEDTAAFSSRKLKLEEINFVSSYYSQDGNNSAVTGGIGSEELTDLAAVFNVSLKKHDLKNRQHTVHFEMGVDHYSSASSDKINPATISSASASDNRFYPSAAWTQTDDQKLYSVGASVSASFEYDYISKGASVSYNKLSKDHNREAGMALSAFLDTWTVIYPSELRNIETSNGSVFNPEARGHKPRNTYNAEFTLSQIINKRMQLATLLDVAYQSGQLGTLYQRVYFTDSTHNVEHLPDSRFKLPVGIRFNYFATDRILFRSFYRFYIDNWGIRAHTAELEMPYKITPFLSVSPFYRFYVQSAADYFAGYRQHSPQQEFYTSDYDLSDFTSHLAGLNLRINAAGGIFGIGKLNTLELRYGHYTRSTGLAANSITLAGTLK